jgi:lysozyme
LVNQIAAKFIKDKEQCRLTAYWDKLAGIWTIGFGATGPDIHEGLVWTQKQADDRFAADLDKFTLGVQKMLKVKLSERSEAAVISLCYNTGMGNIKSSTLLENLNQGDYMAAALEWPRWCHAGGKKVKGLLIRRFQEGAMFLEGL